MAEFIKCRCTNCGAKYRLPVEFQGRTAKCKKCGTKFKIPAEKSLEDSVLDWLTDDDDAADETEETAVQQPRIVSLSKSGKGGAGVAKGPIRMKTADGEGAEQA